MRLRERAQDKFRRWVLKAFGDAPKLTPAPPSIPLDTEFRTYIVRQNPSFAPMIEAIDANGHRLHVRSVRFMWSAYAESVELHVDGELINQKLKS